MAPVPFSSQQWVEKYRPKQVKDVAHQEEVVKALTNTLTTGTLPHLLFYGPPGTGKTTTALAIARQLFGPELYKSRVLELNASDDRGINVVRTKIKDFAAVAVSSGGANSGYLCPPFKIIILDEADSMTEDAQNALRRTMETYSKVTRFCFICNYVSRIIEPLASRCAKFRFKPLVEDIMKDRILHICKEEGLHLDSDALKTLGSVSEGDLRRAITCLQSAARMYGSSISSDNIISVSGIVPNQVVQSLLQACKTGQFDVAQKEVSDIVAEGHPASQIFSQGSNKKRATLKMRSTLKMKSGLGDIASPSKNPPVVLGGKLDSRGCQAYCSYSGLERRLWSIQFHEPTRARTLEDHRNAIGWVPLVTVSGCLTGQEERTAKRADTDVGNVGANPFDFSLESRFSPKKIHTLFSSETPQDSKKPLNFSLGTRFSPAEIEGIFCITLLLSLVSLSQDSGQLLEELENVEMGVFVNSYSVPEAWRAVIPKSVNLHMFICRRSGLRFIVWVDTKSSDPCLKQVIC